MRRETLRHRCRDGLELHCQVLGDGPRSLLCLPGLARTGWDFEGLASQLPPGWQAVCPDYRGRAGSERDPRPARYHLETYTRDTLEWLDRLDIDQAILLGSSFGGWVAVAVANAAPGRVEGLILNDIGATLPRAAVRHFMMATSKRADAESMDPAIGRQMRQSYRAGAWLPLLTRLGFMRHSAPAIRGFREPVRALKVPLMVIRGARSPVLTDAGVNELKTLQPGLELVSVKGVGHAPALTEPVVVQAIRSFLGRKVTS